MAFLTRRRVPPAFRLPPVANDVAAPAAHRTVATAASRELWLALHLPQVILDALGGTVAALAPRQGVAVVDLAQDGKLICACDETATAAGITAGMALNSALALLPALQTVPRDPARERALLDAVADLGLGFTPRVSLEPPDAVLLEVRGSLKLFGGVRALCEQVRARLQAAGVTACLALTPTPLASLWFARAGREVALRRVDPLAGRLASLPLPVTRWPARSIELLVTMGARNLGDCQRLPRDGFARRFEPRLLAMLDRAAGRMPDPRLAFRARERFVARRDLEPELADTQRLEQASLPLLEELCAFLRQRGRGVQAMEWRFAHRQAPVTRLRLRFAGPVGDIKRIAHLFHERLARLELAEPVRALRLASGPLVELPEAARELFVTDRRDSGTAVPQLVERLRARLGVAAVHGLCLVPEHRPESAWRVDDHWAPRAAGRPAVADAAGFTALRPLWLLPEPQALGGRAQPHYQGVLELEEGPECIESGWWDGRDIARDYYVARNRAGVRLWIFRERPRKGRAAGGWFLHGIFG
jgi:protein ImuB